MASALLWLLLLGPILAQAPLLVYLVRNIEVDEAPERPDIWTEERVPGRGPQEGANAITGPGPGIEASATLEEPAVVNCVRCGASNAPRYRFCRDCAGQIRVGT